MSDLVHNQINAYGSDDIFNVSPLAGVNVSKALDPRVKAQIDFTTAEPGSPTEGDRYINTVTGTSSGTAQSVTATYIYEWNNTDWTQTIPPAGYRLWDEAKNADYIFNGTGWMTAGGLLPLFVAYVNVEKSDKTGSGGSYTIVFDSEQTDRGGIFNTATGIFTAPISGYYLFTYTIQLLDLSSANHSGVSIDLISDEVAPSLQNIIYFLGGAPVNGELSTNGAKIIFLSAGKTAGIVVAVGGSAQTVDIGVLSNFQGYLLTQ